MRRSNYLIGVTFLLASCWSLLAIANTSAVDVAGNAYFRVAQVNGKWSLVDPAGQPFFSIGVAHVVMEGDADRNGVSLYKDTVEAKYGSKSVWAKAQTDRFKHWGINTIGAFSDTDAFAEKGLPYTVIIKTIDSHADYFDPKWQKEAVSRIRKTATAHRTSKDLIGYFIDNERPWTIDLHSLGDPNAEVFIMGQYLKYPYGSVELLKFLKCRYASPDALRTDFPQSNLRGTHWSASDLSNASLGRKVTPDAQITLDAWAQVIAKQYFAVTTEALRKADPNHLVFGHKFIAGLTPASVVKLAAKYVDVVAVDFYDSSSTFLAQGEAEKGAEQSGGGQSGTKYDELESLLDLGRLAPTRDMLADWYKMTGKPLLIAEYGYRANDAGLPNTIPPQMAITATQADRARAATNYANCAINTSYILGLHWFQLTDEPAAGRFDGEDSNWGLLTEKDEVYPEVTQSMATASAVAGRRTDPAFKPAACAPVGPQN